MVRIGYRYMPTYASDDPGREPGLLEGTARYPLVRGVLVSNRNRVDFRVIDGDYSWRYRNRLSFERELSLGPVRLNPYARAEVFYDSRVERVEPLGSLARWRASSWAGYCRPFPVADGCHDFVLLVSGPSSRYRGELP